MIMVVPKKAKAPKAFIDWLKKWQTKENWGLTEMARQIEISHPLLSDVITYGNMPSYSTCLSIAARARVRPEFVLRLAGLLPDDPSVSKETEELLYIFENLSERDQDQLVSMARFLAERNATPVTHGKQNA